jgi:iron complex transport system substrate-binding protein
VYVLDSANVTTASHFVIEGAEEMKAILAGE